VYLDVELFSLKQDFRLVSYHGNLQRSLFLREKIQNKILGWFELQIGLVVLLRLLSRTHFILYFLRYE
jgi:hypothetical protein